MKFYGFDNATSLYFCCLVYCNLIFPLCEKGVREGLQFNKQVNKEIFIP